MTTAAPKAPASAGLRALPTLLSASEGWAELRAALADGQSGTIDGAWGSAAALAAATLAEDTPGTLLVVVPNPADAEPWVDDLRELHGHAARTSSRRGTAGPFRRIKGKLDPTTTSRLRLLQQLAADPPKVVVATIAAVCQPVPQRADLLARGRSITPAEVIDPAELAEWLVANGYKRVEAVEYPGEFGRRGGICDIFPPDAPDPVRLEFFGDELESIRTFAVSSRSGAWRRRPAVTLMSVEAERAQGSSSRGLHHRLPPAELPRRARRTGRPQGAGQALLRTRRRRDRPLLPEGAFANLLQSPERHDLRAAASRASRRRFTCASNRSSGSAATSTACATNSTPSRPATTRVLIACQNEAEVPSAHGGARRPASSRSRTGCNS